MTEMVWQKGSRKTSQMMEKGRGREEYGQSGMINQSRFRVHIKYKCSNKL